MKNLPYNNSQYNTPANSGSCIRKFFPSFSFYMGFLWEIIHSAPRAKKGTYDMTAWVTSSLAMLRQIEQIGGEITISGIEKLEKSTGPVIIIGNHMSMMETLLLPSIICPIKPATFVVKKSLMKYPLFKHILRSQDPIMVSRTNPRADFKLMMEAGTENLKQGTSIIIFPQTTRSTTFSATEMSAIGVKLAKKAGVPVVPLALKTDAWQNGKRYKDLGKIDTTKHVYFSFGEPMTISGKGNEEQEKICQFIEKQLQKWQ